MKQAVAALKAQVGKLVANLNEIYTVTLISLGIPGLFWLYIDWRAALASFIVLQIALGIVRARQ